MSSGLVGLMDGHVLSGGRTRQDRGEDPSRLQAQGEEQRVRVVVGDGDVLSRCGLASLLEAMGMSVVGQAADLVTLQQLVRDQRPGLVVLGQTLRAPGDDGLDAALTLRQDHPDVGVVVLATHIEVEPAAALLATGTGTGYLLKRRVSDVEDFVATLHRVAGGGSVVDPTIISEMVDARRHHDLLEVLSRRERDVLSQMAEGRSNCGIAEALWITPTTVEKHVSSILTKLCLPDGAGDNRRVLAVLTFLNSQPA
jgi:DNA-binding NarL/FixJ family response regulator